MRVCNLILAHKNPHQLNRLLISLVHPDSKVYIHVDKKVDINAFKEAAPGLEHIAWIPNRVSVHWGGPSMVMAVVQSLLQIKASGEQYDYINLLSAQDFPLRPIDEFISFLEKHKGQQFISYLTGESAASWWASGVTRFNKYHLNEKDLRYKYVLQKMMNSLLPKRRAPKAWEIVGGNCATWWTLEENCAYYLAEKILHDKQVKKFMRFTWGIDEIIFPTVVVNSPYGSSAVNNNLRYINWDEDKPNPKILGADDFSQITASSHFFARKFDEAVDAKVLDLLEEQVLRFS